MNFGQFNEKILKAIEDFENSLLEDVSESSTLKLLILLKNMKMAHKLICTRKL